MRRPKVLFAIGYHGRFNGAQRWARTLVAELRRQGLDVEPVFGGEGRCVEAFRDAGLDPRVISLPPELGLFERRLEALGAPGRLGLGARVLVPTWVRLASMIRRERFDLVHCNEARSMAVFGVAARLAGRPAVLAVQGSLETYPAAVRWLASAPATRISSVADASIDTIPRPFRRRAEVIRIGVDPGAVEAAGPPPAPRAGRVRVLQVGSYDPHKGQHHLIDAAVRLRARFGREAVEVVMVGDDVNGAYRRQLARQVGQAGLEHVALRGWTPDVRAEILGADIVVQPTVDRELLVLDGATVDVRTGEGTPISLIEAGLAGRPTVATTAAGIDEVVEHGRSGLLVPPRDDGALADAIAQLVGDPELRARMGRAARGHVAERFSVERSVACTRRLYERLACG